MPKRHVASSYLCLSALIFCVVCASGVAAQAIFPGVRATTVDVPASDFSFAPNPAPEFAPINISREGDDLVFTPNGSEPGNTFGFAETILEDIPTGILQESNFLVVVINITYDVPSNQNILPTIRARLHERGPIGNFFSSEASEMQSDGLRDREGGAGIRLSFDRNRLRDETNDMLLALDFFNFGGDQAEPGFELRVVDVRYYITEGDAHSTPEITSAYINEIGGLFMNVTGHDGQFLVDQSIEKYAYDNQYMVGIDFTSMKDNSEKGVSTSGELFGYIAGNVLNQVGVTPIEIATEGDAVLQAAVNGPHVVYVDTAFQAFYWDFIFRLPPVEIDFGTVTGTLFSVLASDDFGTFLFVFEEPGGGLSIYEFNPRNGFILPSDPVIRGDAAIINGRSMVSIRRPQPCGGTCE